MRVKTGIKPRWDNYFMNNENEIHQLIRKAIRVEDRPNGKSKYLTKNYVFTCIECNKELFKTTASLRKFTGFCRYCYLKIKQRKEAEDLIEKCCKKCNQIKPITEFNTFREGRTEYTCKRCNNLVRKFGINDKDYRIMIEAQNNKCAICDREETYTHRNKEVRTLAIDHCHKTGKIRQLLCNKCNMSLGGADERIDILEKMIDYLRKHNQNL